MKTKAGYIMIGGFLGAGKTTAILRLAEHLDASGLRVGLITNDQSFGLVDTAMADAHGFAVEEITGGCFCCKFNSLVDAAGKLSAETRPDAFIAEPVGSCTDLKAAVSFPLRKIYGDDYRIAPLSVLVDPIRALRILGIEPGKAFSRKVLYVYDRQLAEADFIVINKCDLLSPERLEKLENALQAAYPHAEILKVSAREGTGLEAWFDRITGEELDTGTAPDVDYDLYAEGEALLGWLNAAVHVSSERVFDGNALLSELAGRVRSRLGEIEIAHLKMTLSPDEAGGDIGVLNLVRSDGTPELSHSLDEPVGSGELIINARAEGDPAELRAAVEAALRDMEEAFQVKCAVKHLEHFRPGRPEPTYRLARV